MTDYCDVCWAVLTDDEHECDPMLTARGRQRVRDEVARKRMERDREFARERGERPRLCTGCSGDLGRYTAGCRACNERRRSRERRGERVEQVRALFTPQERMVLTLWAEEGYTGIEVAHELGLSPSTVYSHLGRARRKVGVPAIPTAKARRLMRAALYGVPIERKEAA